MITCNGSNCSLAGLAQPGLVTTTLHFHGCICVSTVLTRAAMNLPEACVLKKGSALCRVAICKYGLSQFQLLLGFAVRSDDDASPPQRQCSGKKQVSSKRRKTGGKAKESAPSGSGSDADGSDQSQSDTETDDQVGHCFMGSLCNLAWVHDKGG